MLVLQVTHVEPWEKGSRKTAGQTGMCGGVSGKYVPFIFPVFTPLVVVLSFGIYMQFN